jgi:hypothetical protein
MSENEMKPLESALAALEPRPAAFDRDRLMFLAGQRSAARRGWTLPCLTAALASAGTLLGVMLLYRPEPQVVVRPDPPYELPAPQSAWAQADTEPTPEGNYISLRNRILTAGIDALPPLPLDSSSSSSPNAIFRPHVLPRDDFDIPGGSL